MVDVVGNILQYGMFLIILYAYYRMFRKKPFINFYILSLVWMLLYVIFFSAVYTYAVQTTPLEEEIQRKCYKIIEVNFIYGVSGFSMLFTSVIAIYHLIRRQKAIIWVGVFLVTILMTYISFSYEYLDIDYLEQQVGVL